VKPDGTVGHGLHYHAVSVMIIFAFRQHLRLFSRSEQKKMNDGDTGLLPLHKLPTIRRAVLALNVE
jgi:hypothetical protein